MSESDDLLWAEKANHDFMIARRLSAMEQYSDDLAAERIQMIQGLRESGTSTIRSLFLLNTGTCAAILAFIGSLLTRETGSMEMARLLAWNLRVGLTYLALGSSLAVVASAFAYLDFRSSYAA